MQHTVFIQKAYEKKIILKYESAFMNALFMVESYKIKKENCSSKYRIQISNSVKFKNVGFV